MYSCNKPSDQNYINFLMAADHAVSIVKVAECFSTETTFVSHDSFNRYLAGQSLTPDSLWNEVECFVDRKHGWLILDDTVIDKIYSKKIELTYYQWSGKNHKVVKGIGLISLVWTDGIVTFPIDYRIYDKCEDQKTKNDHFREMLKIADNRGFNPSFVMFDSWYSSNDNLKCIKKIGWHWFTRVKKNRMVNPDGSGNMQIGLLSIPEDGLEVHLKKYGFVRIFHTVNDKKKDRYWATNFSPMDCEDRQNLQTICWSIENYHRVLKGLCNIQKCQARTKSIQLNHINCSIRAYLRFEGKRFLEGITPYDLKWKITKSAIVNYVKNPIYAL